MAYIILISWLGIVLLVLLRGLNLLIILSFRTLYHLIFILTVPYIAIGKLSYINLTFYFSSLVCDWVMWYISLLYIVYILYLFYTMIIHYTFVYVNYRNKISLFLFLLHCRVGRVSTKLILNPFFSTVLQNKMYIMA